MGGQGTYCDVGHLSSGSKPGVIVKTVAEYRLYAQECRRLAKTARAEDKQALETIARAWDRVADERETQLLNQIDGRSDPALPS
jgi:hypothetical protein